jgi:hypothetical protein
MGDTAPPYEFTWAFVLTELADGTSRLVVRERYAYTRRWAPVLVEPVEAVSFAMSQKMLRGIRRRAEQGRITGGPEAPTTPGVYLYWLPLGAGAHVVRISGKVFEAIAARFGGRPRRDLYHSALEVVTPDARFVIEMTPIANRDGPARGVVAEGVVGTKWARPFRVFRYEIRRWRGGDIPDVASAVDSPVRVSASAAIAQRVLDLAPLVPTPVWGRDELHAGEMWNSNSVAAWLLVRSGVDVARIQPPPNGRAPGWDAGVAIAGRISSVPAMGEVSAVTVPCAIESARHPILDQARTSMAQTSP